MEATKLNKLKPNDVALVIRPHLKAGEAWDGNFQVLISGVGPITMSEEDFSSLIHIAMVIATSVQLIDEDPALADRFLAKVKERYNQSALDELEDVKDAEFVLSKYTKTIGGVQ
jgi:predicted DNA-binding helix-hairpin-helix protein